MPGYPEGRSHRIRPDVEAGQKHAAAETVEFFAAGVVAVVVIVRLRTFGGRRGWRRGLRRRASHVGTNRVQIALRPRRREQTRQAGSRQESAAFCRAWIDPKGGIPTNNGGKRVSNSFASCQLRLAGLSCPFFRSAGVSPALGFLGGAVAPPSAKSPQVHVYENPKSQTPSSRSTKNSPRHLGLRRSWAYSHGRDSTRRLFQRGHPPPPSCRRASRPAP